MPKGNNAIPKIHNHKHNNDNSAQRGCITTRHLGQPKRAQTRRRLRIVKAKKIFPRPLRNLRPVVACPTVRYNFRKRLGSGFSLEEIKAAGISPRFARTVGVNVDGRRKNPSQEGLNANTQRLKTYLSKLVVFPVSGKKFTTAKGAVANSSEADQKLAQQDRTRTLSRAVPKSAAAARPANRKITKAETEKSAYKFLKKNLSAVRFMGARMVRAKTKEEKAKAAAEKKAK